MTSQFYDQLTLGNGGRSVSAGGPITWDSGEQWAEFKVKVTQGKVEAEGDGNFQRTATAWSLTLTAKDGKSFTAGPANGWAEATVHNGSTQKDDWTQPVSLT